MFYYCLTYNSKYSSDYYYFSSKRNLEQVSDLTKEDLKKLEPELEWGDNDEYLILNKIDSLPEYPEI